MRKPASSDLKNLVLNLVLDLVKKRPLTALLILVAVALIYFVYHFATQPRWPTPGPGPGPGPAPAAVGGEHLFCFWNVENLFDDQEGNSPGRDDRDYDEWFARDAATRQLKYQHLAEKLLELNQGNGPDILAVAEVESARALELLREELNSRLGERAPHYGVPAFKDVSGGRNISTGLLSRLPIDHNRTQLLEKNRRVLEVHVGDAGRDLVVLVAHWTSRLTDKTGESRAKYADLCYGRFQSMYLSNPKVDLLLCGDFNDSPTDPSVTDHLHAVGPAAAQKRRGKGDPILIDLMIDLDPAKYCTHYHGGPLIYDHLVASPGLLDDAGWGCDPDSVQAIHESLTQPRARTLHPWRFGTERQQGPRGYSDHFPVTVRLKAEPRES